MCGVNAAVGAGFDQVSHGMFLFVNILCYDHGGSRRATLEDGL
jgi:hypothetical protein